MKQTGSSNLSRNTRFFGGLFISALLALGILVLVEIISFVIIQRNFKSIKELRKKIR